MPIMQESVKQPLFGTLFLGVVVKAIWDRKRVVKEKAPTGYQGTTSVGDVDFI